MKQHINPVGIGLAVAGAAAAITAMFLPLAEPFGAGGIRGNSLIQHDAGTGVAVRLGVLAIVVLVLTYRYYETQRGGWGAMTAGVLLAGGAIYDANDNSLFVLENGQVAEPAIALYVVLVGGILAAIGGYLMWTSRPLDESFTPEGAIGSD